MMAMIGTTLVLAEEMRIESAIDRAIIPEVEFRQADPIDAIVFLVNSTMHPATNTPIIGLGEPTNAVTKPRWEPDFVAVNVTGDNRRPISLSLRYRSAKEIIELICKLRSLKYEIVNNRMILSNAE